MKILPLLGAAVYPLLPFCVCAVGAAENHPANWRGQAVTEFTAEENGRLSWGIVNDGVMGGLSEGNIEFTESGTMRFFGDLSLENNGGFTTARSGAVDLDLSNDLGLLLRVKGDGRTYQARLDSDARFRGRPVSFAGEFETTPGKWIQVKIPFAEFEGSFQGTQLPDEELNPAAVERVWILLGDKKQGAFDLEIDWIRTYGKGQGGSARPLVAGASVAEGSDVPASLMASVVADGRFTTLKAALDAAGLTTFFQWDNPLTVFAPTDEAFAKLPDETRDALLRPGNKEELVAVLSHHVTVGNRRLVDALRAEQVKTIQGAPLQVGFGGGRIRVNDAVLIDADIECSDGIIHVVDTVLLPPPPAKATILSTAEEARSFTTLLAAIDAAGLRGVLEGEGPFTVFAPTDEAFAALPDGTVESLLKPESRERLVSLLKFHVVAGRVTGGDALNAREAGTLEGRPLRFGIRDGRVKAGGATLRSVDLEAGNGLIHVIDAVLLPPAA